MATAEQVFNGTAGTAPSAPVTSGGNTWTWGSTPAGTSSDCAHNATQSVRGSMSARCNDTTTGAYSYETPDANTMYFRGYFYLTAAPSTTFAIARYLASGYTASSMAGFTSDRKLWVASNQTLAGRTDSVGGSATYSSSTNVVPLNEWFRIEVLMSQTTWRIKMWKASGAGIHSNGTPDADSGDVTGSTIGTLDTLTIGPAITYNGTAAYTFLSSGQYLYTDDFATSTTGYVGPSVTSVDRTVTSSTTSSSTITHSVVANEQRTVSSATTAGTTITHSVSNPGATDRTVSSTVTTATTVTASTTAPSPGYPNSTIATAYDLTNADDPASATRGGPAILNVNTQERRAISDDLIAARAEGAGFPSMRAAVAALWSAISGKASTSHTHTTSDVTGFDTQVRTSRLDQMATPTAAVAMGSQKITGLGTPTAGTDAVTKAYADALTTASAARQTPGNRVAFIGDSLMVYGPSGWAVTDQITCWPLWASLMTNQRARVVKNAGVSGEQASQGYARFSTDITPFAPTCVVIGFGTNEIASGTSFSTYKTNMINLVTATKAINATPILMLIPPNDYSPSFQASISKFNAWIKTYADANGIATIDVYKPSVDVSDGGFTSSLTYDGGHPNEAGHVAWATAAKTVFESVLPPSYPLIAQDNYEPSNLLANGCFYLDSDANGVPDSWTWSGTGSPSLVTESTVQGKWFRFGGSGARSLSQSETVGGGSPTVSVGDTIAVSGKVRASSMGGTQTYTVTVTFTGGSTGSIKPISGLTQNLTDGTFYQEYVVPSGTTSITVALSTSTGTGVVDFGQVGLFNLTILAA